MEVLNAALALRPGRGYQIVIHWVQDTGGTHIESWEGEGGSGAEGICPLQIKNAFARALNA